MNPIKRHPVDVAEVSARTSFASDSSVPFHDASNSVIYIDSLALTRECIPKALAVSLPEYALQVVAAPSADAFETGHVGRTCCVVYHSHFFQMEEAHVLRDLRLAQELSGDIPMILLSDIEERENVVAAVRHGIRAYIPTSLPLKVLAEAIRLVLAGGTFVPASALPIANVSERPYSSEFTRAERGSSPFTPREKDVLRHLWEGRSNKDIAYLLQMSEGTVKVHIKHIMKRAGAHNRTQAVLLTRHLLGDGTT